MTFSGDIFDSEEKAVKHALHIASKTKFYSELFKKHGVSLDSSNSIAELTKLPIIDKHVLKNNFSELVINVDNKIKMKTSGTTGSGFNFYSTRKAESIMWGFFNKFRERNGINANCSCGYFCGRTIMSPNKKNAPYWRINYPGRQILFSAYHLNINTVDSYISCLNRRRPEWIHGYPSFLTQLSKLAKECNLTLSYQPKAVTTGSENLFSNQRKEIEHFFSAKVFDLYCQTEGVAMLTQCKAGNYHPEKKFSYVEFIDTEFKNVFEIVGTSFYNDAFPFIRYKTGDLVKVSPKKCLCGANSITITEIDGRKEDYIELPNGTKLGRLDHIFKDLVTIREAQILQKYSGEIVFSIVKNDGYNIDDEAKLIQEIESRLGASTRFQLSYVDSITKTKNGKLRFVVKEGE